MEPRSTIPISSNIIRLMEVLSTTNEERLQQRNKRENCIGKHRQSYTVIGLLSNPEYICIVYHIATYNFIHIHICI